MTTILSALQNHVSETISSDQHNALDKFLILKSLSSGLDSVLDTVKEFIEENFEEIIDLSERHNNEYQGHKIIVRNGGRYFNYSNDPVYSNLKDQIKQREELLKQSFIAREKGILVADQDGEEIILPEPLYRKSSISIKSIGQ